MSLFKVLSTLFILIGFLLSVNNILYASFGLHAIKHIRENIFEVSSDSKHICKIFFRNKMHHAIFLNLNYRVQCTMKSLNAKKC